MVDNMRTSLKPLLLSVDDAKLLSNASDSIDELFLFVVVGEFNSGKSTFLNALLGGEHCKSGVLPTTDRVTILRDISTRSNSAGEDTTKTWLDDRDDTISMYVPVHWLRQASIVDTPVIPS
jgi:ribosome biogenesis GTPase A